MVLLVSGGRGHRMTSWVGGERGTLVLCWIWSVIWQHLLASGVMLLDQRLPNLLSGAQERMGLCFGQRVQAALVNYHNSHRGAQLLWILHCLLTPEPPFCLPCGPRLASVWVTLPYPSSPTAGPLALDMGRREAREATLQAIFLYLTTWYLQVYLDGCSRSDMWPKQATRQEPTHSVYIATFQGKNQDTSLWPSHSSLPFSQLLTSFT